jgi:phosphatidylserine/phosphatidylglycerophosphate/cardiolipin synthase-like enzyme
MVARNWIFFAPYDKPTAQLIEFIAQAKKSIHAAVYMITDKDIAQALINAQKRGVDVRIITDQISLGKYGKADMLVENGIPVYVLDVHTPQTREPKKQSLRLKTKIVSTKWSTDEKWFSNDPLMHHKFMIIDKVMVWTGSFNWTGAANKKNHENVIASSDREICKQFDQHFSRMMTDNSCKPYYPDRISIHMPTSLAGKVLAAINQMSEEGLLASELIEIINKHQACTLSVQQQ